MVLPQTQTVGQQCTPVDGQVGMVSPFYKCLRWAFLGCIAFLGTVLPVQASDETVYLQLKWRHAFQFAGYYMALEKGYYQDAGLNVRLIEGGPGKSSIDFVEGDSGRYGIADSGVLLDFVAGKNIKVLAAVFQHSPLALVVKQDSGINKLSDLKGKRIMLQKGSLNANVTAMLSANGLSEKDYVLQDISYDIMDLIHGKTDAFSVYLTDQPHQLKRMGIAYKVFDPSDYGIDFYGDLLLTSDAEVKTHPQRARAFRDASLRGWAYALDHVDEAVELIFSRYNTQHLSQEHLYFEAAETARMIQKDYVTLGFTSQYRWESIAKAYAALGALPQHIELKALVYQPKGGWNDIWRAYKWQIAISVLLFFLLALLVQAWLLRRMVHTRTEKLQESEERFRTLVENLPGVTYRRLNDEHWTMLYISDSIEQLSGYQSHQLLENSEYSFASIIHPEDKKQVRDEVEKALVNHAPFFMEYRICHADGSPRWLSESGQGKFDSEGELLYLDGNIFDITERKAAEALQRSTADVLEMIARGENIENIFIQIVKIFEARYPQMRASILRVEHGLLRHAAAPSLPEVYTKAIDGLAIGPMVGSCGTAAYTGERVIVDDIATDPRWEPYRDFALSLGLRACWSEPAFDANGVVCATFAMYYDTPRQPNAVELQDAAVAAKLVANVLEREKRLHDLKHMEEKYYQAQKMEAIGTLVGGIAHDFNNMLAGIIGNLYLARQEMSDRPGTLKRLEQINMLTTRASDMIKHMLSFARKGVLEKHIISLRRFLQDAVRLHRVVIPENIELSVHIDAEMHVYGDETQLQQVLLNLLTNACDALNGVEHGCISIDVTTFEPDEAFLNRHPDKPDRRYVRIRVQDNGLGIPPDIINHIFEPFFTTKEAGLGTGLGLSMLFGVVQSHDGLIDVLSEPGEGSRFEVYLPLVDEHIAEEISLADESPHGEGELVLVVDDEMAVRQAIADVLTSLDYQVLMASNGVEAMALLAEKGVRPDVLITDVVMPKMGGVPLMQAVRQLYPGLPVIFITGYDRETDLSRLDEQAGHYLLLDKPAAIEMLAKAVRQVLTES